MDRFLRIKTDDKSESSINIRKQNVILQLNCKVCGATARYNYFGVIVCCPCKVFFKRNAQNPKVS